MSKILFPSFFMMPNPCRVSALHCNAQRHCLVFSVHAPSSEPTSSINLLKTRRQEGWGEIRGGGGDTKVRQK